MQKIACYLILLLLPSIALSIDDTPDTTENERKLTLDVAEQQRIAERLAQQINTDIQRNRLQDEIELEKLRGELASLQQKRKQLDENLGNSDGSEKRSRGNEKPRILFVSSIAGQHWVAVEYQQKTLFLLPGSAIDARYRLVSDKGRLNIVAEEEPSS